MVLRLALFVYWMQVSVGFLVFGVLTDLSVWSAVVFSCGSSFGFVCLLDAGERWMSGFDFRLVVEFDFVVDWLGRGLCGGGSGCWWFGEGVVGGLS